MRTRWRRVLFEAAVCQIVAVAAATWESTAVAVVVAVCCAMQHSFADCPLCVCVCAEMLIVSALAPSIFSHLLYVLLSMYVCFFVFTLAADVSVAVECFR